MAGAADELRRYWRESARPWPSLLFVAPMLLSYEAGLVLLGPQALRNGADVWLRRLLDQIGFGQHFLLPLLTCGVLLAWHHMRREQWRVDWPVISGMVIESAALGMLLLAAANGLSTAFAAQIEAGTPQAATAGRLLGFFGAGIYEELLFRMLLLPAAWSLLRAAGCPAVWSVVWAAALNSLAFSLAHYQLDFTLLGCHIHTAGEQFDSLTFSFRMLAGAFFSTLFVCRGFGIAAGAHALYDIFVTVF